MGENALQIAVGNENHQIVEILISSKMEIDRIGDSLLIAIWKECKTIVNIFLLINML
jgi:hypothetical protein